MAVDTVAPVITLRLGDGGQAATTDAGVLIVIHRVPQFSPPFVDPGVVAFDETDGNLTAGVTRFGLSAVDTAVLTPLEQPYLIDYHVTDAAGNAAQVR